MTEPCLRIERDEPDGFVVSEASLGVYGQGHTLKVAVVDLAISIEEADGVALRRSGNPSNRQLCDAIDKATELVQGIVEAMR